MKFNSKWMRPTIVFGVLSLIAAQVEPAAFGQKADDSVTEGRAPQSVFQGTSSEAPAEARQPVTQVATQGRPGDVAVQANRPPAAPAAALPKSKSKVGKWFAIIGAGVAAAAVASLARGGKQPGAAVESPAIMVGPPTVGQAQ